MQKRGGGASAGGRAAPTSGSLRRRPVGGGGGSAAGGSRRQAASAGGGGDGFLRFSVEGDSQGLKVGPTVVLAGSLLFIVCVILLHIWGKFNR